MPHHRKRHLLTLLEKTLRYSPIVGVLGHRQVGKTTISSKLGSEYKTLDLIESLEQARTDPVGFLEDNLGNPLVIDECQLAPELFPALKERVRQQPKPGQFLITGSVRFTSRKAIRESLTGRIISWELLPMDLAELNSKALPDLTIRFLASKSVEFSAKGTIKIINKIQDDYLIGGGLPGIAFVRSHSIRTQKLETQIETLLERDLRLIIETTLSFRTLRQFLVYLANHQGQPFELAESARATRISIPTLRKIILALESIFLIRVMPTEGGEKRPVILFEDQGEATYLQSIRGSELSDFERFIYANIRTQWMYRPENKISLSQYRTRGGACIPFVLRNKDSALGIIPILEENPTLNALGSANSFLKFEKSAKIIFVHPGKKDFAISSKQRVLPASLLLGI